MKTYYSPTTNGFYDDFLRESYEAQGTWPDDLVEISQRWREYLIQEQGNGKIISPNEYGQPVLTEQPAPTEAELYALAESKKLKLMAEATDNIAPLQDAIDLGEATPEEIGKLESWKRYRVMLNRLDMSAAPSIEWPELPA
ncbi:tail fiber assembly protein [Enterobacter sp. P82]|uniref:tail fiber assembly protein n=1 Tax=Enterobacter sp. P82 TaxID=3123033 RepID=UPI00300CA906